MAIKIAQKAAAEVIMTPVEELFDKPEVEEKEEKQEQVVEKKSDKPPKK